MDEQDPTNTTGQQTITFQVPSKENIASRRQLIPIFFAASLLLFLLDFCQINIIWNGISGSVTGFDFLKGVIQVSRNEQELPFGVSAFAIISFTATVVGLIAFLIKEKREDTIGTIAGFAGLISLLILQFKFKSFINELTENGVNISFQFPYWGALLALGTGGVISYLRMQSAKNLVVNYTQHTPTESSPRQESHSQDEAQKFAQPVAQNEGFDFAGWVSKKKKVILIVGAVFLCLIFIRRFVYIPDFNNVSISIEELIRGITQGNKNQKAIYETPQESVEEVAVAAPPEETVEQNNGHILPFTGRKYYNTHPTLSGKGTPRYFVEIRADRNVYFGYEAPDGPDFDEITNAGQYKPIVECKQSECAIGQYYSIAYNEIQEVDETGELIFGHSCCESFDGDSEQPECPCISKYQ